MSEWRPSAALARALLVAVSGCALAVLFGDAVLMVLSVPFALLAAFGLLHRPTSSPVVRNVVAHRVLHEGQGTTSSLVLHDVDDVEHVVRAVGEAPYVAMIPASGVVSAPLGSDRSRLDVALSPRRWGRRLVADERVALHSTWGGYRWGSVNLTGAGLQVLPGTAPFDSRAEMPAPAGLVGAYRSRRVGTGAEFAGIRPFQAGDRLKRIDWRVSLRSEELHVVEALSEEDTAVLIVVDALADYGRSGGLGGEASSLDLTVRAAAALAEHHTRAGDRVGLRVLGRSGQSVGFGSGRRHLRRVLGTLAEVRTGIPDGLRAEGLGFHTGAGSVVVVLSPMLHDVVVTAAAGLTRRGLPVLVVDTLPPTARADVPDGYPPRLAALAWRMLVAERRILLDQLAATGCPVVPWAGPGALDRVLRMLARRATLPQPVRR